MLLPKIGNKQYICVINANKWSGQVWWEGLEVLKWETNTASQEVAGQAIDFLCQSAFAHLFIDICAQTLQFALISEAYFTDKCVHMNFEYTKC